MSYTFVPNTFKSPRNIICWAMYFFIKEFVFWLDYKCDLDLEDKDQIHARDTSSLCRIHKCVLISLSIREWQKCWPDMDQCTFIKLIIILSTSVTLNFELGTRFLHATVIIMCNTFRFSGQYDMFTAKYCNCFFHKKNYLPENRIMYASSIISKLYYIVIMLHVELK
jgi:hypothetical protein